MTTQPSDETEFPPEIILKPVALVGLSGLDTVNNAIHKTIWDAFSNNRRQDRASVRFRLLNNTLEFPVVKPKRNSYEWYIPKGILKKNWINKRVALIPAVVVIFYDMEWDDPQWNEKIIECASRVQSVRAALEGHASRVAVVVMQSGPPMETALGAERAQSLYVACEIQPKSLFILPYNDHLMGYIIRLENAFYDIAQNYYHYEMKAVKQHREHLNKTTHQYLFVRHQFKLGYLNELKQDPSAAHKHYLHAYNNLLETRTVDTNVQEVLTVAGFINYKLCKLLFALNLPRDAIAQFKTHIDRYKGRTGPAELLFEHYAWLARQYSAFGELFDEAIRAGLPAIHSQHPGFYYQQAAQYTSKRRQAMRSSCMAVTMYPPLPDPLDGPVDFYGQRPWRPGRLSADPHDLFKEQTAIQALQYNEKYFNHSTSIINYLGSAISQFKTFHSPRMRKQLVVEMANEYYFCADYGKALTLLTHMLWDYRKEKWWYLASYVLNRALQCAYLVAKIQDYLQLSVEALSKHIEVPNNDKNRIYGNIMSVLRSNVPAPEPELPPSSLAKASDAWRSVIEKEPFDVTIDMANISSFIEVKPRFSQKKYRVDETINIELFIKLYNLSTLHVKRAQLCVTSRTESIDIPVAQDVLLRRDTLNSYMSHLKIEPCNSGTDVRIESVTLVLDEGNKRKINMNFKLEECNRTSERHRELQHLSLSSNAEFDSIASLTVAHVTAREGRVALRVDNDGPALQGEWFVSTFTLTNHEHTRIYDMSISLSLLASTDNPSPDAVTELTLGGADEPRVRELSSAALRPDESATHAFYVKSNKTATTTVQIRLVYFLDLPGLTAHRCIEDLITEIAVVKPFDVTAHFLSLNFKTITKCYVGDPFILMPQIKILSPRPLEIENTELDVDDCFEFGNHLRPLSSVSGVHADEGNLASDALCVRARHKPKENSAHIGLYNIKWRRIGTNARTVMSSMALPGLPVVECPVSLHVSHPEVVTLQTCVPLRCALKGLSRSPVSLCVSVEGTDGYMFSGYKKMSVVVPPHGTIHLCFNIHPLTTGRTAPPRVTAVVFNEDGTREIISDMLDRTLPRLIYVMPK